MTRAALATLAFALGGCGIVLGDGDSTLYDAPWPDERLRQEDGTVDISAFPLGTRVPLRAQLLETLSGAPGFGLASAVYFTTLEEVRASSLPTVEQSVEAGASVVLVDVDVTSPERGRRAPVEVRFAVESTAFAPAHTLSVLPLPGRPLRAGTLYAAVVLTDVLTLDGRALDPSMQVDLVSRGHRIEGLSDHALGAHATAIAELGELGVRARDIADLAVFRTGPDPAAQLHADVARVLDGAPPLLEHAPRLTEHHPDYCVFETQVRMPQYQAGSPPYLFEGGGWARDAAGHLVLQRHELARLLVTVPRRTVIGAYPVAVLVRTGAGGDRPLTDRGRRDAEGQSEPGTGLAAHFARAGYMGISVDGPLGGLRNVAGWDEQFAMFNVLNLEALRDNVRQSALELALLAHILEQLNVDARDCAGASPRARASTSHLALVGHSMGATIAPLVMAVEPRYGAMILSGAGASWIRQVIYKRSPLPTRELAEIMLGYSIHDQTLAAHDPLLSLLQWGGEPADPQLYGRALAQRSASHVLVFQGLLDTYIPPPVANPLNRSMHLDLAGPALDEDFPEFRSYLADAMLGQQSPLPYPASGNGTSDQTQIVIQHAQDALEDGHEVLFQLPGAQRQLRCFLESYALGTPVVVEPGDPLEDCPSGSTG